MLQQIRLLIFDLDYLVFDCAQVKVQALRQSLKSLGDAMPLHWRPPDGGVVEESFRDHGFQWMRHLEIGLGEENVENFQQVYDLNESRFVEAGAGRLFPGVQEFIVNCRNQDVAVALGAEASRRYLVSVADRHQLDVLFEVVLCTEEFGAGGTDEMLEEIMHLAEVNPSETLVLGTRPQFFQAAHQVGVLTIGCGWGVHRHQGLAEADLQSPTLSRLYPVIREADHLASRYS